MEGESTMRRQGAREWLEGPLARQRIAVLAVSAVLFVFSGFWGLSEGVFGGVGNPLGAVVESGRASNEVVYFTVRNAGGRDWFDVRLIADERYVFSAGDVPSGGRVDARMSQFGDRMALPRAGGQFLWDGFGEAPAVRRPSAVVPSRLRIQESERVWETDVRP
ncbi:MAG: hypothetical protein EA398_07380 [Deltaproteobacteria bacterium]|nr:MAG: hypothetical protein EA398_07380 [Deltaproteobacteria bacterium]